MTTTLIVAGTLLAVLVAAELALRAAGFGDPVLWRADPEIEYLAQPSSTYRRFGRTISYNAYSMRSRDFAARREDPRELRVLVVGDSIVNGGSHTDQGALATALLERRLGEALNRPVVVGNVGAPSWGPPNYEAYLRRYGLMDADVVVVVVNSRDATDAPTFEPLDARRPRRRPPLALLEVAAYVPRLLRRARRRLGLGPAPRPVAEDAEVRCLAALRAVIERARAAGAAVLVAQHLRRDELDAGPDAGHEALRRAAEAAGVTPIQLGSAFADGGAEAYHDAEHPSARGQSLIADALERPILDALESARVAQP